MLTVVDSLTQAEEDALLASLNNGTASRASVLRQVADNALFRQRQFNSAFVLMQYIGYLRRDPDPGGFCLLAEYPEHERQLPLDGLRLHYVGGVPGSLRCSAHTY